MKDVNFLVNNTTTLFTAEDNECSDILDFLEGYLAEVFENFSFQDPPQDFKHYEVCSEIIIGYITAKHKDIILEVAPIARKGTYSGVNFDYKVTLKYKGASINYIDANYNSFFSEKVIDSLLSEMKNRPSKNNIESIVKFINKNITKISVALENLFIWAGATPLKRGYTVHGGNIFYEHDKDYVPPKLDTKTLKIQ